MTQDSRDIFAKLLPCFKKSSIKKPPAPGAEEWLDNFYTWLEEGYPTLVHHERESGLHASELFKVCPRREVLVKMFNKHEPKETAGQKLTYDVGHALHYWWQHRYLGPAQQLWGNWFCAGCQLTTTGFMPMKCPCGSDWRKAMNYMELEVRDPILGYVGHSDGIVIDRVSGLKRVFEFKTKSPSEFKKLKAPSFSHIIQAHAYMRKLGPQEAIIVYQDKGTQADWDFSGFPPKAGKPHIRAFIVKYDPKLWEQIENRIVQHKNTVKVLDESSKNGIVLNEDYVAGYHMICASKDDDAAKYCPVRDECFRMRSPGNSALIEKPKHSSEEFFIPA